MASKPLPLEATGVPPGAQAPPAAAPLNMAAPPPQPVGSETLGLLGALTGLGLNIASIVTGRAPAGGGTLQFANQQLAQSAENKRRAGELEQDQSAALALWPQALTAFQGQPNKLQQARVLLEQGRWKDVQSLLNQERLFASDENRALREEVRGASQALQLEGRAVKEQEAALEKSDAFRIGREAQQFEEFVRSQPKFFADWRALKAAVNQNPQAAGFKTKLNDTDAQTVFAQYSDFLASQRQPREVLGVKLPFPSVTGKLPEGATPATILANFAESRLNNKSRAEFEVVEQALRDAGMKKAAIQKLQINLRSPKKDVRRKAVEQAFEFLGGADVPAASPDTRIRVQDIESGQTGSIPAAEFDPAKYRRL